MSRFFTAITGESYPQKVSGMNNGGHWRFIATLRPRNRYPNSKERSWLPVADDMGSELDEWRRSLWDGEEPEGG